MNSYTKRVALVTGSTQGIGLEIARKIAAQGAQIVLNGLETPEQIKPLSKEFEQDYGKSPLYISCDLSSPSQIEAMMQAIDKHYGRLDILINNAGIQHISPITEFPVEIWERMIAINLSASFHTIRLGLPLIQKNDCGRIINISSISGLRGRANKSGYNATKHALIGLTKSVALELAGSHITCNALCPGWVHTELVQKQIDRIAKTENLDNKAATKALLQAMQPSGRFVTAGQIAELVLFLCSAAAAEINGVAWAIDGGTTAQ